jgi:hypothetical protein
MLRLAAKRITPMDRRQPSSSQQKEASSTKNQIIIEAKTFLYVSGIAGTAMQGSDLEPSSKLCQSKAWSKPKNK